MTILNGWHRGEVAIQKKLGYDGVMSMGYTWIDGEMPEEHRTFYTTRLPFIPVVTLDAQRRPWTSIFAAANGEPGFVTSPSWDRLDMDVRLWDGEPFWENAKHFDGGRKMLMAGIGIELSTRRRNKFAGHVSDVKQTGPDTFRLKTIVNQAIGNCPKYINVREFEPHPNTTAVVAHKRLTLSPTERLPDEVITLVQEADTVFLGSSYHARPEESLRFPSHVGQNQRAGRKGFVRVRPSDGRTVVLPDYSGNRLMTSLGNIEATPLASLSLVDYVTGDILYLTGDAETLVGPEALAIMPRQKVITLIHVTGYILVRGALPLRQRPGTEPQRSPYSPPIRLLAEELASGSSKYFEEETAVSLARIKLLSNDLATFTWETSRPVIIRPGQTAILDFTDLIGTPKYAHMAPYNPTSVNDDRIRTWTVSSAHLSPEGTTAFDLTMREKPGGVVTGALFTIARKLAQMRPQLLDDTRPLELQIKLVGISGTFTLALPPPLIPQQAPPPPPQTMLWLAGGIGVTPFLSMLAAIAQLSPSSDARFDVVLALATREPEVLVPLLVDALGNGKPKLRLAVHVFSAQPIPAFPRLPPADELEVSFTPHQGRIGEALFRDAGVVLPAAGAEGRVAYVCGPEEFERGMLDLLDRHGVRRDAVIRESFEY